jgi:hypothetical protein
MVIHHDTHTDRLSAIRLSASSMIFKVEMEIVIKVDGSINKLFSIQPNVELIPVYLPKSITKKTVLENEWVKTVINGL